MLLAFKMSSCVFQKWKADSQKEKFPQYDVGIFNRLFKTLKCKTNPREKKGSCCGSLQSTCNEVQHGTKALKWQLLWEALCSFSSLLLQEHNYSSKHFASSSGAQCHLLTDTEPTLGHGFAQLSHDIRPLMVQSLSVAWMRFACT